MTYPRGEYIPALDSRFLRIRRYTVRRGIQKNSKNFDFSVNRSVPTPRISFSKFNPSAVCIHGRDGEYKL